jgi:hypothetical protein
VEYIAECFWAGVREDDLERLDHRVHRLLATRQKVTYLGSMLVPEDEVVFCFFDGPSAEAVRTLAERAEVPFQRVVRSMWSRQLESSRAETAP